MTTKAARFPKISEDELQTMVIAAAKLYGWRCCHFRPARTEKGWRTPVQGDKGLPDLVLARDGVVLLVELKAEGEKPTDDQALWLEAAVECGRVWKPADWYAGTVVNELRRTR